MVVHAVLAPLVFFQNLNKIALRMVVELEARVVPLQDGGADVLLPLELVLEEPVADAASVELLDRDALLLRYHPQQVQ